MEVLQSHPAADAFPMMDKGRFDELAQDINANGLRQPIVLCDGQILDGRNRYKACLQLDIEPPTQTFQGNPWDYVWSLNGARRDLVAEQRYLIWKMCHEKSAEFEAAAKAIKDAANQKRSKATKKRPRNADGTLAPVLPQNVAALDEKPEHREANAKATASRTNRGAVHRGDTLAKERPDLAEQVRMGTMKPTEAHRQMKRDKVADKVADLPDGKYTVIYADPPWKYGHSREGGKYTGATDHYPTMPLSDLKELDVKSLAADDCVLWLWATAPLLPEALELGGAWGFKYKTHYVWDKMAHNMGHYSSVQHELLLVMTRGSCLPHVSQLPRSVIAVKRTEHSRKPHEFRELIDTLYPHGQRIELFARGSHDNWKCWGNEAAS